MEKIDGEIEVNAEGTKSFRGKDFLWSLKADNTVELTRVADGTAIAPDNVRAAEMNTIRDFILKVNEKYGLEPNNSAKEELSNPKQESNKPKL